MSDTSSIVEKVWLCTECDKVVVEQKPQKCCNKRMEEAGWFETTVQEAQSRVLKT